VDQVQKFQLGKAPFKAPDGCIGVGGVVTSDGSRYSLVYQGRDAHLWNGAQLSEVLDRAWVNPSIAAEVAEISRSVFGQAWPDSLALITGIDRRRLSGSRLEQSGLPPKVLVGLALISASPEFARALGSMVISAAYLADADVDINQWPTMLERAQKILGVMSD
jgi:hypothetical protein